MSAIGVDWMNEGTKNFEYFIQQQRLLVYQESLWEKKNILNCKFISNYVLCGKDAHGFC